MLHDDVKKAVDSGDISSLKYIFSTCLDGDPTFDKYIEDYEYCKSKDVLFVPHIEIHPMTLDSVDEKYWVQLQKDFRDNPSIERIEHMREVAKILYKDRIRNASETVKKPPLEPSTVPPVVSVPKPVQRDTVQTSRIEQPKPVLQDNTRKGYSNATEGDGIIRRKEPVKRPEPTSRPQQGGTPPKKASGVGYFIILACLIVAVIVVVMISQNKYKHESDSPHTNSTGNQTVVERISETQSVASTGTPIVQESNGGVKPHNQNSESSGVTSVTSTSLLHYTGVLGHSSKSGSAGLTEQEITIESKNDSSSSNTDSIGNQVNSTSAPMPQSVASFDTPITQESDDRTDSKHSDSAIPESELSVSDTKSTNNNQQPEKDNTPSFIEETHSDLPDNSLGSPKNNQHAADCRPHPRERVKTDAEGHVKSEPIFENLDAPYVRPNLSEIGAGVAVVGGLVTVGGVIVGSTFVTALGATAVVIGDKCYFLEGK